MHLRWTGCSSASCRISNDRGVHEGCHVNPHREDVRWVRLDEHAQTEFNVLPVHCVNLGVLDQPPALIERHKGGIEWESPYALVDGISILHLSEEFLYWHLKVNSYSYTIWNLLLWSRQSAYASSLLRRLQAHLWISTSLLLFFLSVNATRSPPRCPSVFHWV